MIMNSTGFTFNGMHSDNKGVCLVSTNGGLYSEPFLANRKLIQTRVNGKTYFKRVEKDPLSFPITLYIEHWQDWNNLRDIARWLDTEDYCEFYTDTDPERIYYVMLEGASEINHNGIKQGYITLNMVSETEFTFSPNYNYNLSVNSTSSLNLFNEGDEAIRPYMIITKIGDGDISIENTANNQVFTLTGLYNNEVIYVDCVNEEIKSSLEDSVQRYLYDNHNDVWLDFDEQSTAIFNFVGNFNIDFTLRYVYKSEVF